MYNGHKLKWRVHELIHIESLEKHLIHSFHSINTHHYYDSAPLVSAKYKYFPTLKDKLNIKSKDL